MADPFHPNSSPEDSGSDDDDVQDQLIMSPPQGPVSQPGNKDTAGADAPDGNMEVSSPAQDEEEVAYNPEEKENDDESHNSSSEEKHGDDNNQEPNGEKDELPLDKGKVSGAEGPPSDKEGKMSPNRNNRRKRKRASGSEHNKLLQDCISVEIPLDYTADLAIAVRHTRQKRIAALQEAYPNIFEVKKSSGEPSENGGDRAAAGTTSDSGKEDGEDGADVPPTKKRKKSSNAPDRKNYSSMLDYLEAKYVKGVMIDHDDDRPEGEADEDEDDRGSIYSEDSFFDDEALKRDVASQVLANSTTTKMELQESDSEFFVNVGNLEVEETDYTKEHYDPLQDVDDAKKAKVGRKKPGVKPGAKREKLAASAAAETKKKPVIPATETAAPKKSPAQKLKLTKTTTPATKKEPPAATKKEPPTATKKESGAVPKKELGAVPKKEQGASTKKDPVAAAAATKKEPAVASKKEPTRAGSPPPKKNVKVATPSKDKGNYINPDLPPTPPVSVCKKYPELKKLLKIEAERKVATEKSYQDVVTMIKEMPEDDLPRRKTKDKVTVTVPSDRKPGDSIFFQNPHVEGQRLKVKIPKNTVPGGTFKVTVPIPKPTEDDEEEDHNSWSREFYESLSDYAYCYDAWMDAIQERQAIVPDTDVFPSHFEKRKKFDQLMHEFPNQELKTPIDKAYLQKILRRARQNKHKRDRTAKRLEEMAQKVMTNPDGSTNDDGQHTADGSEPSDIKPAAAPRNSKEVAAARPPPPRVVALPVFGRMFPKVAFSEKDFL